MQDQPLIDDIALSIPKPATPIPNPIPSRAKGSLSMERENFTSRDLSKPVSEGDTNLRDFIYGTKFYNMIHQIKCVLRIFSIFLLYY